MSEDTERLIEALTTAVVDSFEKLETLVVIARQESPQPIAAVASLLGMNRGALDGLLAELAAHDVLELRDDTCALRKEGPWSAHVGALAQLHAADRMRVVMIMSESAVKRLRMRAAQAIADAFIIKRK